MAESPLEPVAARSGLSAAGAPQFSLSASIGGPWGMAESVLPITLFSAVYGVTRDLRTCLISALVPAALLAIRRLLVRQSLTQAFSGLFGLGLGAFLAARSGRAEDVFLPSIWKNLGFGLAYALSAIARWPVIGLVVGQVVGEGLDWRQDPPRRRVYQQVTWLWVGVFALRLAVQVPLYLSGQVTVLGAVNVPLGLPLFGVAGWLSWVMLRRVPTAQPRAGRPQVTQPQSGDRPA